MRPYYCGPVAMFATMLKRDRERNGPRPPADVSAVRDCPQSTTACDTRRRRRTKNEDAVSRRPIPSTQSHRISPLRDRSNEPPRMKHVPSMAAPSEERGGGQDVSSSLREMRVGSPGGRVSIENRLRVPPDRQRCASPMLAACVIRRRGLP